MVSSDLAPLLQHIRQRAGPADAAALPDVQLLERLVHQRDQRAFETLLGRHGPLVWRVCRRVLRRPHDAEEAFQNTFLVLFQNAGSIRKTGSLSSWLHGVAYRVASRMRQEHDQVLRADSAARREAPVEPDRQAVWRELGEMVERELSCLPEKYRQPLLLCYWEGLTNEEVAHRLGWACGTVKTRLARARRLLHERLAGKGIVLPAGLVATLLAPAGASALPMSVLRATTATLRAAGAASPGVARAVAPGQVKLGLVLLLAGALAAAVAALPQGPPRPAAKVGPRQPAARNVPARHLDLHGDPLPEGALARVGTVRLRHGERVTCVDFSPDGRMVASGGYDRAVALWAPETGKELARLTGHRTGVEAVAFSPDGKFLASGGGGPFGRGSEAQLIRVWDIAARRQVAGLGPGGVTVESLALSCGGKHLAAVLAGGNVDLWDVPTARRLGRFPVPGKAVLSRDARLAAWAARGRLVVLELASGKETLRLDDLAARSTALTFSPDGLALAVSDGERCILLLNAATGKQVGRLTGPDAGATAGAFLPGGKVLATWGGRGPLCLWDLKTGQARPQQGWGHGGFAFGKDRAAARGHGGQALELWQYPARRPIGPAAHQGGIGSLALAAGGTLLATGSPAERCVRLWDTRTWRERSQLRIREPDEGRLAAVSVSADGKILAVGGVGRDNRGNLVPVLWLLGPVTGKRLHSLQGHRGWARAVAFSPDSKLLASGDTDGCVLLWEPSTGKLLQRLRCRSGVGALAFSPDGRILAAAENGPPDPGLCLWQVATGELLRRFPRGYCDTSSLAFSADSRMVAVASGEQDVNVWEVATGQKRLALATKGKGWVRAVAFSPNGALLGAGAGNDVHLWGAWSGQVVGRFSGHRGPVESLTFSSDGQALISGSEDTTALVWDLSKLGRIGAAAPPQLASREPRELWQVLASEDGGKAYGAMRALAADPVRACALLGDRLRPVRALTAGQQEEVNRLIRELDDDRFEVREGASRQLAKRGEAVEPALRLALVRRPSPEVERRLKQLLSALAVQQQGPEGLRHLRALEVLERLAAPQACRVLERLAGGAPPARLTREAKACLARLGKQGRKR
jgi:RNA polymerase sigma factor (sigma-70 family)